MLKWKVATLFAQQEVEPLLEQLDPPHRAMVLMAILGLVLLGVLMVACAMLGARWVRREARQRQKRNAPIRRKVAKRPEPVGRMLAARRPPWILEHLPKGETRTD